MKTTQEKQGHARTHKTVSSLFCRAKQDWFMCAGFSTLELLMAFVVLTLSLTAVIMLVFGNQSMAIDTELAQRGVYLAEQQLEEAGIMAQSNFESVSSTPTTTLAGTPYSTKRTVLDISPCAKQVTDEVFWKRGLRNLGTKLTSAFMSTDIAAAVGGNCSPTPPASDWDTPKAFPSVSSSDFDAQGTGVDIATIDGARHAFLVTNEASSNPNKHNFYSVNTTDPENIDYEGEKVFSKALNGIAIGKINGNTYAFVLLDDTHGQLQVVDVSDPDNPAHLVSASSTLPNITNGIGRSILYHDKKVYVGTQYVPCPSCPPSENNELHVYDVSNPTNPNWPQWEDSIDIDRNVNDIIVHDNVAYVATGPGSSAPYTPLKIFDLSSGTQLGAFEIPDAQEGTSVYLLGDKLYLGLKKGTSEDDFYILDVSEPANIDALASENLGGNNTAVGDIVVQGPFAFIGMEGIGGNHTLQVWNVMDSESPWRVNTCITIVPPLPQNITGLAYTDDLIFGSFRSNATLRIIYDDPALSCTP